MYSMCLAVQNRVKRHECRMAACSFLTPAALGICSTNPSIIHLGVRDLCASARSADWHVPGAHFLESWSDVRSSDGTYSVIQPMIAPLSF